MLLDTHNSRPFFSIVTISYNQAEFLRDTIESILGQDFSDYEYIIQDPGSSDGSRAIIHSYGSRLIPLYKNDSGPADGLNKAFNIANGKYFLYINSDDSLMPGALGRMYKWILADDFNHDVYSGGCRVTNGAGAFLRAAYSDKMNLRRAAYGKSIVIQPSSAISSAAYRQVGGFNVDNKSNWDGELFVDLALNGFKFTTSMSLFSNYRVHESSITGSGARHGEHVDHSKRMFEKITGTPASSRTRIADICYGIERKLLNPYDTLERILKGPVFKRGRLP